MRWLSIYRPGFATSLAYMLQSTEYQPMAYLRWFWRTDDFASVMHRRTLEPTLAARFLLLVLRLGMFLQVALGIALIIQGLWQLMPGGWQVGLALVLSYPVIWAHAVAVPLVLGRWFVAYPRERRAVGRAERIFANHPGIRLAVAGSYGKTSMKELLKIVLSESKKVAATPANKNVASSHARFAQALDGDEDIIVLEYGEGQPGDVARFARYTHPTHAVITGLAPAHLDRYKNLAAAGKDIFSVSNTVSPDHVYVNADSTDTKAFVVKGMQRYSIGGALGWKVSDISLGVSGTSFVLTKGNRTLPLSSGLLGRHNIGPLAFVAAFAMQQGLTSDQVIAGVAKTVPYEHRMQPTIMNGALVIDDTYNGNLEGIRAGTALLAELPGTRKWYITPGLVDQGRMTKQIHHQMGQLIAQAQPDVVVLMDNSVQPYIFAGLHAAGYTGEIRIESDSLEFYTNLPQFLAAGDLVMMQNDWTDNYA